MARDRGRCADCSEHENRCMPFRPRKNIAQEQMEREDNGGEDPACGIDSSHIKQADSVL